MNVGEALAMIRNNLLEDPIDGPFTDEVLVSYLNEALRHVQAKIVNEDPGGWWFASEADVVYPANTRWYVPNLGGYISKIYTCRRLLAGSNYSTEEVAIIDPRLEQEWTYTNSRNRLGLMLRGKSLGLRVAGSERPPTTPTTLRLTYLPPFQTIDVNSQSYDYNDLIIGEDIPIPLGFEETAVAYVVVLCQMAQETPSSQFESRYAQLESTLLENVRRTRQTQSAPPLVRVTDPYEYE